MNEAWKTRSGEADNSQVRQQGDDLAALQRKKGEARNRPMVEEALSQEKHKRQSRLNRRAKLTRARQLLTDPRVYLPISGIAALLIGWILLGGWIKQQFNPPVSLSQVNQQSAELQTEAERRLGAPVSGRNIKESANSFLITYRVRPGSRRFNGGRVLRPCRIVLRIDKADSELTPQVVSQKGC